LKKLSTPSPSALLFSSPSSSRPSYNNCLHLSWRTSPFRKLQHKTSSRSLQLLQRSLFLPTKTSRKREKTIRTSAFSTHTNLSHAHNTSALPTSIRPLRTNPCALLSVYLTSCCAEKKRERRRRSVTVSPAAFLSRPSPHACTYLHVCVPMVPCLFDMITSRCQLDLHILPIIF
jgi:hypothetical protein